MSPDSAWKLLVLESLAASNPQMPIGEALEQTSFILGQVDWTPMPASLAPEDLADWAMRQSHIRSELDDDRYIQAIALIRRQTRCSLKEAKDAVDLIRRRSLT